MKTEDPIWIRPDVVREAHRQQLEEHGGANGVRDPGLLESALSRPRQRFAYADPTPTIPELAAAYAFGIAKNHPFIDGNKRAAAVVSEMFLNLNGFDLTASDVDWCNTVIAMAAGELSEEKLAQWLTANAKQR